MNEGLMTSLKLGAKVLVVLLLPLLLFRYVDSQPAVIVSEDDDEGTRSIAVVNEDRGWSPESSEVETIELGQQISSLLNSEGTDYSWTVVTRSAAEQGFSNERYDAIIYVPSRFSENVMTFREDIPSTASINYVIQPNLVAKERQRVHREMANAQNKINKEMSMIYWSYVSQEVDNIRDQFDLILEKEIEFQDAMYSFYSPSSASLANEIDQHKSGLENILNQTSRMDEVSSSSADAASEAEGKISTFTEALEMYKESQFEQQLLLQETQAESKVAIQDGVTTYDNTLIEGQNLINEQLTKFSSPEFANDTDALLQSLGAMEKMMADGDAVLQSWSDSIRRQRRQVERLNEELLSLYQGEVVSGARRDVRAAANKLKDAPATGDETPDLPSPPEEGEAVDLGNLKADVTALEQEVNNLKNSSGEEPPAESEENEAESNETDWSGVDSRLSDLKTSVDDLESSINTQGALLDSWKDHVDAIEDAYRELAELKNDVSSVLTDEVLTLQDDLSLEHVTESDLRNKELSYVLDYLQALYVYKATINQQQNDELIQEVLAHDDITQRIDNLFEANTAHSDELQKAFDKLLKGSDKTDSAVKKVEKNFYDYAAEAEAFIDEYNALVDAEHEKIQNELGDVIANSRDISTQIQELNAETFDWEESPSLQYLDGQMVFSIQQTASADLNHMAELVSSLDESQASIFGSTDELQTRVSEVQQQSDELNDRWAVNVGSTELIRDDVHDVLGNTVVDGQENPFIYSYLSSPVEVEGHVDGQVLSETEDRMPPVIMFVIILLSGLLIGFLSHYYSHNSYLVQSGLFILLNLAVGLIISIYGLNIYTLDNTQSIQWSIFTILLLFACSNIVRGGLFIGPFAGWLASIVMIMFFITPLINIIVPEFNVHHPIERAYMSLQYGGQATPYMMMGILLAVTILVSAFIYMWQILRINPEVDEDEAKQAS
ncbi:type VII secretion protein EsaA [Salipaludibacillus agaradhaerens]|uniref:Type VII secretion protein EsaA n=1 Tax=Salipaludibacillus agaradhaerens TaxID=76935 RepID=A0A9Q4AYY2_SALAG|nr:type VII secretion protein EsaA [Salipaludibacillus agaradhaerens]MCR6094961.1 type VII secretion protein EsaA [Salipaludibacillus agaradhaerens]MCR6115481.1 type VII secretion protein EsaA [Salipaludibacillus agaradhaerens]